MSSNSYIVPPFFVFVLVFVASVTLSSSSSGSVSIVLAVCIEMLGGLGAGSTVHSSSSGEVIRGSVTYGVEFSSYHTTYWNSSKLVEEIFYLWEYYCLANLEPLVYVVFSL